MTHQRLHTIGTALWGTRWQTEMAEALQVHTRTLRRWIKGDAEIPPNVWDELQEHIKARIELLQKLLNR